MNTQILIRGGEVIDGSGLPRRRADVLIEDGQIISVFHPDSPPAALTSDAEVIDATARVVMPGCIDAHSHAEAVVFSPEVQVGLLRDGVTSIIGGQDGVGHAPGDGSYASDYFGALLGPHPHYRGDTVAELLRSYDGATALNVGYLVPAGTVRHLVSGYQSSPASPAQIDDMTRIVSQGMQDGALGISTGLDYVPNIFQDTAELTELTRPVARFGGVYVSHMRGGYESNVRAGLIEAAEIAEATGVMVHISHLHGPADLTLAALDELAERGVSVTFDTYPYLRGCTLAAMPLLPPEMLASPRAEVVARLQDPAERSYLLERWFPSHEASSVHGAQWPESFTFAHIDAATHRWAEGLTVAQAATQAGLTPQEFVIEVLIAAEMNVSCIVAVRDQRSEDELARLLPDHRHTAGSDGIWIGGHPHPRARATFASFLGRFTRERADWSLEEAAIHLSTRTAQRFHLAGRGMVRPGYQADLIVVDPLTVAGVADYAHPLQASSGIDDVVVNGVSVLRNGQLTGATPGVGLRRSTPMPN